MRFQQGGSKKERPQEGSDHYWRYRKEEVEAHHATRMTSVGTEIDREVLSLGRESDKGASREEVEEKDPGEPKELDGNSILRWGNLLEGHPIPESRKVW